MYAVGKYHDHVMIYSVTTVVTDPVYDTFEEAKHAALNIITNRLELWADQLKIITELQEHDVIIPNN